MTSSPSLPLQQQSPSHYSNRAREKRCTRAKELLVELIKAQTTHHVDPKDVKTTKPSSAVSWRFEVEPGTEFPFVQLSSISRTNLDLLEKAIEGGGVRVVWTTENELFQDSKRPRKRAKHSADSDGEESQLDLENQNGQPQSESKLHSHLHRQALPIPPLSQASASIPPPPGAGPSTSFTTVNGPPPPLNNHINHMQHVYPTLAVSSEQLQLREATASTHYQNGTTSSTMTPKVSSPPSAHTNGIFFSSSTERTVTVEIPISSISRILASERDSLIENLRAQNAALIAETTRMQAQIVAIQGKYDALEGNYTAIKTQLQKNLSQMNEIIDQKKVGDEGTGGICGITAKE